MRPGWSITAGFVMCAVIHLALVLATVESLPLVVVLVTWALGWSLTAAGIRHQWARARP